MPTGARAMFRKMCRDPHAAPDGDVAVVRKIPSSGAEVSTGYSVARALLEGVWMRLLGGMGLSVLAVGAGCVMPIPAQPGDENPNGYPVIVDSSLAFPGPLTLSAGPQQLPIFLTLSDSDRG